MKEKGKIKSIIAIRGVAVALVMLSHFFSERALDIKSDGLASATLPLGHIGVTLFFIVSGFVLPYSMYKSEYEIKNFPRYLYRRAVRIEPPYIASIFLVLLCMYTKHLIGQTVNYSGGLIGFFSQFLYLNDILGLPWLNIVYWTLALEFQFYLLIGLLFPLLNRYNSFKLLIALVLMVFLKFLSTQHSWIFYYIPFFVIGFSTCCYRLKRISANHLIALVIICILINFYGNTFLYSGIDITTIVLFLLIYRIRDTGFPKWLIFIGQISYSIYLIHNILVAGLAVFDSLHLQLAERIGLSIVTLLGSIYASFLFYCYIEKPFHLKAQNIKR